MSVAIPPIEEPRVKRWTVDEYHEMIRMGAFRNQRLYLFRGELIEMPPQNHPHGFTVMKLNGALNRIFDAAVYDIRIQLPFCPPGDSEPEPDAAICTHEEGLRKPHPSSALLVIEVSDTSLREDRKLAEEYAAARVRDYWIIDINGRRTEVYRDPVPDESAHLGWRYSTMSTFGEHEPLVPMAAPKKSIILSTLLPIATS